MTLLYGNMLLTDRIRLFWCRLFHARSLEPPGITYSGYYCHHCLRFFKIYSS